MDLVFFLSYVFGSRNSVLFIDNSFSGMGNPACESQRLGMQALLEPIEKEAVEIVLQRQKKPVRYAILG